MRYLVINDNTDEHEEVEAESPLDALETSGLWRWSGADQGDGATVWQKPVEFYVEETKTIWKESKQP